MPSPPPTNMTVRAFTSMPSCSRTSAFGLGRRLKAGLMEGAGRSPPLTLQRLFCVHSTCCTHSLVFYVIHVLTLCSFTCIMYSRRLL